MFAMMLKSFLPPDLDMDKEIERFRQLVEAAQSVAAGVHRIEQKVDSEIVTLKERVGNLELQLAIVPSPNGESNGNRSYSDGATDPGIGIGVGNDARG